MGQRMFGMETEYAFTALDPHGRPVESLPALQTMLDIAQGRLAHFPDGTRRGMFLGCGGRFYIDVPDHPEFSTPEVTDPWDAVRYLKAGDRIVENLCAEIPLRHDDVHEVFVSRCNVDYSGSGSTLGSHESHLHFTNDLALLANEMIPFLVSRVVYTGAGGFNSLKPGALQFALSPRVWHLTAAVSAQSTDARGIFHTKDESHAGYGYHRLHILCGESTCSETSTWLKVATTALVVALIDAGFRPGERVRLVRPLSAMRRFTSDPACRAVARTVDGRSLSALAIQRHYLEQVEARLGADCMPPWAEEACRRWRAILDRIEEGPAAVSKTLDWAIKLALYAARAKKAGVAWESLPTWNHVVRALDPVVRSMRIVPDMETLPLPLRYGRASRAGFFWRSGRSRIAAARLLPSWPSVDVILSSGGAIGDVVRKLTPLLERNGLSWDGLAPFLALRNQLCEIDTRFSQLGERGIFAALDRSGTLEHRVAGIADIDHAMEHPPASGRARLRGECIRRFRDQPERFLADWRRLLDTHERRQLDLSDPFAAAAEWRASGLLRPDLEDIRAALRAGISVSR